MVWLKRQQQVDAGRTALVGLMDALLQLQQGEEGYLHATEQGQLKVLKAAYFKDVSCTHVPAQSVVKHSFWSGDVAAQVRSTMCDCASSKLPGSVALVQKHQTQSVTRLVDRT